MQLNIFRNKRVDKLEQEIKALLTTNQQLQTINQQFQTYVQRNIALLGNNFINDSIAKYPDWGITDFTNKYVDSDAVYSVVNKIAETSALIPIYPYLQVKDKELKQLKALTQRQFYTNKGLWDIKMIQLKALIDAPDNDDLNALLETPNPLQSKNEFNLAAFCYWLLNGECFIYKYRVDAGANQGKVKELHIWPPDCVILNVTRTYPQKIVSYTYTFNGQRILENVPVTDVIHWKRFNPTANFDSYELRGLSPLKALTRTLTRLDEADTRSLSLMKNGGTPGIVYAEDIENSEIGQPEFDAQRKSYYDFKMNPENVGADYWTAGKKGYISTGLNMADLKLLEAQKVDFKRLCNAYKISDIVFNNDAAATESNVKEQVKQMYTNACLPMVYSYRDKLNKELAPEFDNNKDQKHFIDADISSISELQDDMLALANILGAMPITPTGNEMRSLFKFDAIEDALMDQPLVKSGYTLLSDISMVDITIDQLPPP